MSFRDLMHVDGADDAVQDCEDFRHLNGEYPGLRMAVVLLWCLACDPIHAKFFH